MRPLLPTDPRQIGPYELESILGVGSMGVVYLGRSPGGRPAAIKVINPGYLADPEALARFRREAAMLGTVRSAYTAALIDCELTTPPYWIATEFIPGPTLAATIADEGPLSADRCAWLMAALAEALRDIHKHDVCHRDVKPQNVILSPTGPQLIDFGLARAVGQTGLTEAGIALGTPGFFAPELITSDDLTAAADVFALGATITNAATGRRPYGDGSLEAVYLRLVQEDIDLAGVDAELDTLIRACVVREPAARPEPDEVVARCRRLRDKGLPVASAVAFPLLVLPRSAGPDIPEAGAPRTHDAEMDASRTVEVTPWGPRALLEPAAAGGPSPHLPVPATVATDIKRVRSRPATLLAVALAAVLAFAVGAVAAPDLLPASAPVKIAGPTTPASLTASPIDSLTSVSAAPTAPTTTPAQEKPTRLRSSTSPSPSAAAPVTTPTTADGRCIQMPASGINSAQVSAAPCDGSVGQKWTFTKEGALANAAGTKCLDIGTHGGVDIGYRIQIWDCHFGNAQLWIPQSDQTLYNARAGRCLGILPQGKGGPRLALGLCTATASHRWRLPGQQGTPGY